MQRPDRARPSRDRQPCARGQIGAGADGEGSLILGAVIAGGQSSRFGSDKAEALLGGTPLVEHAANALRDHVDAVVLVGRERAGWLCLEDRPRAGLGPLGGIAAALHHATTHGYDHVMTIGCDMPRLPVGLLDALIAASPSYCRNAPILGCWPTTLAPALGAHVEHDAKRSIRGWAERVTATAIDVPAPLANINTPADLAAL